MRKQSQRSVRQFVDGCGRSLQPVPRPRRPHDRREFIDREPSIRQAEQARRGASRSIATWRALRTTQAGDVACKRARACAFRSCHLKL